jgi:hypothetical protein
VRSTQPVPLGSTHLNASKVSSVVCSHKTEQLARQVVAGNHPATSTRAEGQHVTLTAIEHLYLKGKGIISAHHAVQCLQYKL